MGLWTLDWEEGETGSFLADAYLHSASTGTALTATITDAVGIVNDVTGVRSGDYDPVGILDDATAQISAGGTAYSQTITDALGLLDSTAQPAALVRSQTDALGLLDSTAQVLVAMITQTDPLGIVDDATAQVTAGGIAISVTVSRTLVGSLA